MMEPGQWIKSSRSAANGQCVEVRANHDGTVVSLRDSKNTSQTTHMFTRGAWDDFIEGVKAGQFDLA